jgi:uncharacterized phage-associated protein
MKTLPVSSLVVASFFIAKGVEDARPITNLKAQKLVYIAHGWYLGFYGKPLIEDEVEAWQYGPVIPRLYRELQRWNSQPITFFDVPNRFEEDQDTSEAIQKAKHILEQTWQKYGCFDAFKLVDLTHRPNTPWFEALFRSRIDNDSIAQHYKALKEQGVMG